MIQSLLKNICGHNSVQKTFKNIGQNILDGIGGSTIYVNKNSEKVKKVEDLCWKLFYVHQK